MTSPFRIRVFITEKDPLLRNSYEFIINGAPRYVVVGSFENIKQSIDEIKTRKPDIVILDPDQVSVDDIRKIKCNSPHMKVLIWTSAVGHDDIFKCFRSGANGYILNDGNYNTLLNGLNELANGGAPLSREIARTVVKSFHVNSSTPLTSRETQILDLLARGKTPTDISSKLAISRHTSRKHISNIYMKLKVKSRAEAISFAAEKKYIVNA
jgi:DNA-binding NarL/FixJ family response regulator